VTGAEALRQLRDVCLAWPATTEARTWGHFRVAPKKLAAAFPD
jgi:hypothetical protein